MGVSAITVVYLVWAPLGEEVVRRFARSYQSHPAGVEHGVVAIFNGFAAGDGAALDRAQAALDGVSYQALVLDRPVFDLAAYRLAAARLGPGTCCFLNSYTELLADGWLAHLHRAMSLPGVTLAGASGSWGSHRSYARYVLGLGGPYASVFTDRTSTARALAEVGDGGGEVPDRRPRSLRRYRDSTREAIGTFRGFDPFPAVHVRTTGFMIAAEAFVAMLSGPLESKFATYRAESGADGLSARILARGGRIAVVDRNGRAFRPDDWPDSRTFWQAAQDNLLIADKQTNAYASADLEQRRAMSRFAWGLRAAPATGG